jgi:hypothetical protein
MGHCEGATGDRSVNQDPNSYDTTSAALGGKSGATTQGVPPSVDGDGKLILTDRIPDPKSALNTWQILWQADYENMVERASIARLLQGFPPFSQANDRRLGKGGRTNVNFGHVRRAWEAACAPYDLSLESMFPICYIPTNYGDEQQREWMEPIISEEWSRAMLNWSQFHHLWQQNTRLFNSESVSLLIWEDELDWQWGVQGMQMVKFCRRVQPNVEKLDVWVAKVDMLEWDLFKRVRNPNRAEELGWNPEAVRQAVSQARPLNVMPSDFEEWQKIYKNLDMMPQVTAPMIETIHIWAQELDGTISHYIGRYDGAGPWLYKQLGKYKKASDFMTMFTADVGTTGDLHGIRGLPHHLFNAGVMIDRTLSTAADAVIQASTTVLKFANNSALNSVPYRRSGAEMWLSEGVEFGENKSPKFQETLEPWYRLMMEIFNDQGGSQRPPQRQGKAGPYVSDMQAQAATTEGNQLTAAAMNRFFPMYRQHFQGVIMRMIRKTYDQGEPGGREVWDIINNLEARGVPRQAWYDVNIGGIEINPGIGRGSLAARQQALDTLMEKYQFLDESGQNKLLRAWVTFHSNPRWGKELVPLKAGQRPPQDLEDADNENIGFASNPIAAAMVKIKPNQNNEVHCRSHCGGLTFVFQQNAQGQMPLDQAVQMMTPWHAHATEHWKLINPQSPAYKELKAVLEQMNEFITNGAKHIAAEQQKAMEAQQGAQGAPDAAGAAAGAAPDGAPLDQRADTGAELSQALKSTMELQQQAGLHTLDLQKGELALQTERLKQAKLTQDLQRGALGTEGDVQP